MSCVLLYVSDVKGKVRGSIAFEQASTAELLVSTDKSALSESLAGQYVSVREEDINTSNFATRRDSQEIQISINLLRQQYLPITI